MIFEIVVGLDSGKTKLTLEQLVALIFAENSE